MNNFMLNPKFEAAFWKKQQINKNMPQVFNRYQTILVKYPCL